MMRVKKFEGAEDIGHADLATIAVIMYLGDQHNDKGSSTQVILHYDSLGVP